MQDRGAGGAVMQDDKPKRGPRATRATGPGGRLTRPTTDLIKRAFWILSF